MNSWYKDLTIISVGGIIGCLALIGLSDIVDGILHQPKTNQPIELIVVSEPVIQIPKEIVCLEHKQCRVLAEAIFFEARGEPVNGQYAVAFTVLNRRDSWRWPNTVDGVVYQQRNNVCQYSYYCELQEHEMKKAIVRESSSWNRSLAVAYDAYYYVVHDFTGGSDHYYNPKKVSKVPRFAVLYEYVAKIGDHQFYKSKML